MAVSLVVVVVVLLVLMGYSGGGINGDGRWELMVVMVMVATPPFTDGRLGPKEIYHLCPLLLDISPLSLSPSPSLSLFISQ